MAWGARDAGIAREERRFDMRELWRVGLWGIAAAGSLTFLAIAGTSQIGKERMVMAYAQMRGTARPPVQVARGSDPQETGRLAETVRMLSADRERLSARIATLERNLTDMTGSIARPSDAASATQTPSTPAVIPPEVAAPVSVPVPRPPPFPSQTQAPAAPPENVATRPEFGVDLGGATTVEGLRTLWAGVRSRHGGLLDGLRPIVSVREVARPGGVELRLVAGPFPNAASAARLCATLASLGALCQPALFDGQRLAAR